MRKELPAPALSVTLVRAGYRDSRRVSPRCEDPELSAPISDFHWRVILKD
jgi:hypothetical protein